jgi:hypothetical protein
MFQYVTRAQWGARSPSGTINKASWSQRNAHITHYSAGPPDQTVRAIQNFHMDSNGWPDIGYNWLVDRNGTIYEGRIYNYDAIGTHAANNNTRSIGTCFIGRDGDVTSAAKYAIREIYDEAVRRAGRALQMLGHRDVNSTECPGNNLWTWVHAGMEAGDMDLNEVGGIVPGITNAQVLKDIWVWTCGMRGLVEYDAEGNPMRREDDRFAQETWQTVESRRLTQILNKPAGEFTPEQLNAIKEAAREGAAAGAAGASPEEVEEIVDRQLDQAFGGGADAAV